MLPPPHPIEYRSPAAATRPARPGPRPPAIHRSLVYRCVLACWLVPLVIGLAVATLYTFTAPASGDTLTLVTIGDLDIVFGTLAAALGGCGLIQLVLSRWNRTDDPWLEVVGPAVLAAALLASNFAVALVLTLSTHALW